MTQNEIIQYTIVGIIVVAAIVWIFVKSIRRRKSGGSCCGCALADSCRRPDKLPQARQKKDSDHDKKSLAATSAPKEESHCGKKECLCQDKD